MLVNSLSVKYSKSFITLALLFVAGQASAATFNVTSAECTGSGSIVEAIDNANASPGIDTISIQPGLSIKFRTCPITGKAPYAADVNESLIIQGNGATLQGNQDWVNTSGTLNPQGCPSDIASTITVNTSPGFLSIGNKGANNSGIEVEISDLTARDLSAFARVYERAQLELEEVHLIDIQDAIGDCNRGAIDAWKGSSISVVDSSIENFKNYGDRIAKNIWNAALSVNGGSLYVKGSQFSKPIAGKPGGAVYAVSSDVAIVSSRFYNAGGISFLGSADAPSQASIVNSAIQTSGDTEQFDRIYASFSSDVDIQASTVVSLFGTCDSCPPGDSKTMPFYAVGGRFNLSETAIGAWGDTIPGGLLFAERGGSYTADPVTYIQPIAGQDAASLRALTGQAALLTDPPALPGQGTGLTFRTPADYVRWITPIVPGALIDRVTDAGAGGSNVLRDPFDGAVITKDVFGNDRVDANGSRNIGAVQLSLAPSLHAVSGDAEVTLDWTRPQEPPDRSIQGYDLCTSEAGVACTTWVPLPDILTLTVDKLDAGGSLVNGRDYDFKVRARYGPEFVGPYGPESNLVTETPFGPIEAPVLSAVPGDGEVNLNWTRPDDGGHGLSGYAVFYRLAGSADWSPWRFVQGGDTLQATVSGLTNGREWEFGIHAISPDSVSSDMATAVATPWPVPNFAYATPITVSESSLLSTLPNVSNLSQTPLYILLSGSLPPGLTLDNATGEISGAPALGSAATYNLTVLLSQAGLPGAFDVTANLVLEVVSTAPELRLHYPDIDVSAGAGPVNAAPTVTGSQGGTLSFALDTGSTLPGGLILDPVTGRITGIPMTASDGFLGLTVTVTEQVVDGSFVAESPLIVQVRPTLSYDPVDGEVGDPVTITPLVSPSAIQGTFAITAGTLPQGLTFDPATGIVSGTPSLSEFELLTITYSISGGQTQTVSDTLAIAINDYAIDFSYPQPTLTIGQPFSLMPTVSGKKGTTTFSIELGGTPPAGLTLDPSTGEISGIMTSELNGATLPVSVTDQYSSARAAATLDGVGSAPVPTPPKPIPVMPFWLIGLMALAVSTIASIRIRRYRQPSFIKTWRGN